jgi:hypothetical protein
MAFGFYQSEITGSGCFSWEGPDFARYCVWDGPDTPISSPHYTEWTGFYVTRELAIGGAAGFVWNLDDDYGTGLSPKYRVRISGQYDSAYNESFNYALNFSGGFSVLIGDSGTYGINTTGEVASGLFDVPTLSGGFSGYCESGLQNLASLSGGYSGYCESGLHDTLAAYSLFVTGEYRPNNWDLSQYSINISGGLTQRITGGSGNVGFTFSSFTYEILTARLARSISGSGNVGFLMSSFGYHFTEV